MSHTMSSFMPPPEVLREVLSKLPEGWIGEFGTRLQADRDGAVRDQYQKTFTEAIDKARSRLSRPLVGSDFAATQATIDACEAAVEVLNLVWQAMALARSGARRSDL
jgi:hypothetical protein